MFALTCPVCGAEQALAARRLLVRVEDGPVVAGELLFTCLSCGHTVALPLDVAQVAALVGAGVTHLSLSAPVVES